MWVGKDRAVKGVSECKENGCRRRIGRKTEDEEEKDEFWASG